MEKLPKAAQKPDLTLLSHHPAINRLELGQDRNFYATNIIYHGLVTFNTGKCSAVVSHGHFFHQPAEKKSMSLIKGGMPHLLVCFLKRVYYTQEPKERLNLVSDSVFMANLKTVVTSTPEDYVCIVCTKMKDRNKAHKPKLAMFVNSILSVNMFYTCFDHVVHPVKILNLCIFSFCIAEQGDHKVGRLNEILKAVEKIESQMVSKRASLNPTPCDVFENLFLFGQYMTPQSNRPPTFDTQNWSYMYSPPTCGTLPPEIWQTIYGYRR